MGHFHQIPSGERISGKELTIADKSVIVGFWGYIGFNGSELDVRSDSNNVTLVKGAISGNSRNWEISGLPGNQAKIAALYTDKFGVHIWDWFQIKFVPATIKNSKAGQAIFLNMNQCGITALEEILNQSISEGIEYAGLIFQRIHSFGFTVPIQGEPDSALPGQKVPAGTIIVGTYHTHGNKYGAGEIFSPQDRGFHNLRHWFAYLGTPTRAILKFTPKECPPGEHPALAVFGGKSEKLR